MKIKQKKIFLATASILSLLNSYLTAQDFLSTDVYCVVLAGGTGERLWPLSTKNKPKQFLSLDGEKSLLEATFDRLEEVTGTKHRWVVTTQALESLVKSVMKDKVDYIVAESESRNTGPAILYTLMKISELNPHALVIFLPADHYIPDDKAFSQAINAALYQSNSDHITLLGIKPSYAATGYGYIQVTPTDFVAQTAVPVLGFFEKPSRENAENYVQSQNMLWNAGIFCGKVKSFIDEYELTAPSLVTAMHTFMKQEGSYTDLPNISIDYAVLEKSKQISVLPVNFEWSDIGNLSVYLATRKNTNTVSTIIEIDSKDNLIQSQKKVVALIDVENLCIIETENALLIAPRQSAERVKKVVEALKKNEELIDLT
jgi:mannose-1-phosphate guanylyltransferase/mannose-6-phosphate isomerase